MFGITCSTSTQIVNIREQHELGLLPESVILSTLEALVTGSHYYQQEEEVLCNSCHDACR
jgi:hypothetical protein